MNVVPNLDQVRSAIDALERIGGASLDAAAIQQALFDIATSMSAVAMSLEQVVAMERSEAAKEAADEEEDAAEEEGPPPWLAEVVAAIRSIQIQAPTMPAPVVNMPALPAPLQSQLLPSGLRMRVTKRDDLGRLAEVAFIPEN